MDSELLPARIKDLIFLCEKTSTPKFFGFLTSAEAAIALNQLRPTDKFKFFGGCDGAERTVLAVIPDWCDDPVYPIVAFTFTYRKCDTLTHRDFLGALMALGIARETVGDILVEPGRAVVFAYKNVSDFICSQINKIGNVGVKITLGFSEPLPQCGQKQEFVTTIASTRLDCVVSALCGISRKYADDIINEGFVSVNSIVREKTTYNVTRDDTLTVRKKGRFEIVACNEYSKKGRIILKYNKYV